MSEIDQEEDNKPGVSDFRSDKKMREVEWSIYQLEQNVAELQNYVENNNDSDSDGMTKVIAEKINKAPH